MADKATPRKRKMSQDLQSKAENYVKGRGYVVFGPNAVSLLKMLSKSPSAAANQSSKDSKADKKEKVGKEVADNLKPLLDRMTRNLIASMTEARKQLEGRTISSDQDKDGDNFSVKSDSKQALTVYMQTISDNTKNQSKTLDDIWTRLQQTDPSLGTGAEKQAKKNWLIVSRLLPKFITEFYGTLGGMKRSGQDKEAAEDAERRDKLAEERQDLLTGQLNRIESILIESRDIAKEIAKKSGGGIFSKLFGMVGGLLGAIGGGFMSLLGTGASVFKNLFAKVGETLFFRLGKGLLNIAGKGLKFVLWDIPKKIFSGNLIKTLGARVATFAIGAMESLVGILTSSLALVLPILPELLAAAAAAWVASKAVGFIEKRANKYKEQDRLLDPEKYYVAGVSKLDAQHPITSYRPRPLAPGDFGYKSQDPIDKANEEAYAKKQGIEIDSATQLPKVPLNADGSPGILDKVTDKLKDAGSDMKDAALNFGDSVEDFGKDSLSEFTEKVKDSINSGMKYLFGDTGLDEFAEIFTNLFGIQTQNTGNMANTTNSYGVLASQESPVAPTTAKATTTGLTLPGSPQWLANAMAPAAKSSDAASFPAPQNMQTNAQAQEVKEEAPQPKVIMTGNGGGGSSGGGIPSILQTDNLGLLIIQGADF